MACIGYNILEIFSARGTHPHGLKFWDFSFFLSIFFFFFFLILGTSPSEKEEQKCHRMI